MSIREIATVITAVAGVGLLAGLGVLFFGSPEQAVRVPWIALLTLAVVTMVGAAHLQASKRPAAAGQKSQSLLSTFGFAILVVVAFILIGFFMTHH